MTETVIDLATWPRADAFRLFRTYDRPHYAITTRIDMTAVMTRRASEGLSPYRATLHAIGKAVAAVPELRMRFRGETVVRHDAVELSMTVPMDDGSFRYGYAPCLEAFADFETAFAAAEARARSGETAANTGARDDLVYVSCLPWLDYTALDNALPGPADCIPRFSWGRIVPRAGGGQDMAMTLQVHHAMMDGAQVGQAFAAISGTLAAA